MPCAAGGSSKICHPPEHWHYCFISWLVKKPFEFKVVLKKIEKAFAPFPKAAMLVHRQSAALQHLPVLDYCRQARGTRHR